MSKIKKFFVDLLPGPFVRFFAKPYIGGYGIDAAVQRADELWETGISTTMDLLGESVKNEEEVAFNLNTYLNLIDKIKDKRDYISVSIKLTAFGILFDQELAEESVEKIVTFAHERGVRVTLDMEDSTYTDITLAVYKKLLAKYPGFGTVLQSRLFRTDSDIDNMLEWGMKLRIRTVIGIYLEPSSIALTKKSEMKEKLVEQSEKLLRNEHMVEFATHDKNYIRRFEESVARNYHKDDIEFQQLLGVPLSEIQKELVEKGYSVRLYLPFVINKKDATAYLRRRMMNNPKMVFFVIKNLFGR